MLKHRVVEDIHTDAPVGGWGWAETLGNTPDLPPFSLLGGANPCAAHPLNWIANNAAKISIPLNFKISFKHSTTTLQLLINVEIY